ncbi:MAG: hypothetical protein ACO1RA_04545 [Planctomycetaceae bacterium]
MDFEERLRQAVERGTKRGEQQQEASKVRALTEDELKRLHSQQRLEISDYIEACLKKLPLHFPGFQFETLFGDRGWGGACSRDDLRFQGGTRSSDYSRLEVAVRPYSPQSHVVELVAKGTVRNKEAFNRNYYEKLGEAETARFCQLVDAWILEFAEIFAAVK